MNSITVVGRLGSDPETRQAGDANVTTFSLAESIFQGGEEKTLWYRVNAWRKLGETCSKYLHKGDQVTVMGMLSQREFTDRAGNARTSLEISANNVGLPARPQTQTSQRKAPQSAPMPADEDELPF